MSQIDDIELMKNAFLRMFISALLIIFVMTIFSPVLGLREAPVRDDLNLRQRIDQIFFNEIRNAQKNDDVFRQMWTLRRALNEMQNLKKQNPTQSKHDEKLIKRRMTQIRKMIAKETACEVL